MAFYDAPAIKRIQRGTHTATSTTSSSITIDTINVNKSILLFTYKSTNVDQDGVPDAYFSNSTTIQINWDESSDLEMNWIVLEFERGVKVQHYHSSSSGLTSFPINKVDLSKSFIITTFLPRSSLGDSVRASFDSSGESVNVTENNSIETKSFQIIEWNGAKVQSINTGSFSATSHNESINEVNMKKTLLFGSHTHEGDANEDISVSYLSDSTTLRFEKAESGSSENHTVFVVELPEINVQSGYTLISDGNTSTTETISRTFSSHSFPMLSNRGDGIVYNNVSDYKANTGAMLLSVAGDTLTIERDTGTGDSYIPWLLFEYKERLSIRKIKEYISNNDYSDTSSYNVSVEKYTPEKTLHWAWTDEEREGESFRFDTPGSKVVDNQTMQVMIANSFDVNDFDPRLYMIEFDTGVTIQQLEDPGGSRPAVVSCDQVDLSNASVFSQIVADAGSDYFKDERALEFYFSGNSSVIIDDNADDDSDSDAGIQVIEFHDCHTRNLYASVNSNNIDVSITRLDPSKSFLVGSSFQTNSIDDVDRDEMQIYNVQDTDTFNISSQTSRLLDTTAYVPMIEGPSQVKVQHKTITLTTTSGVIDIDPVKLDRSFVRINGWNATCGTALSGGNARDTSNLQARAYFGSNNQVVIQRATATVDVTYNLSIIEVDPYPIEHFKRRATLTIQGSQIHSDGDFPVHLTYDGSDSSRTNLPEEMFTGSGFYASQRNGGDIRVSLDPGGTGLLPLEIVDWHVENDPISGRADAWCRVPLTSGTDKDIYIWYSTGGWTQQPSPWLDEGAYNVWPTGEYVFVSHMSEYDANTTGSGYWDSTAYDVKPTIVNVDDTYISRLESPCGVGISGFNTTGGTPYIEFHVGPRLANINSSGYTVYIATKTSNNAAGEPLGIGSGNSNPDDNVGALLMDRDAGPSSMLIKYSDGDGGTDTLNLGDDSFPDDTHVFFSAGMTDSEIQFASRDDESRITQSFGGGAQVDSSAEFLYLFNSKRDEFEFEGLLSEVVIKASDDGNGWDKTFYNTMFNPSSFISVGTPSAAWIHSVPVTNGLLAQWDPSYSDSITLSGSNVTYVRDLATGFNLYKDSTENTPSYPTGVWNSLNTLRFNKDNTEVLSIPWIPIEGSSERFVWVVTKSDLNDTTDRTLFNIGSDNGAGGEWRIEKNTGDGLAEVDNGPVDINATGIKFTNGPLVYGINHDGSSDLDGTWFYRGGFDDSSLYSEDASSPGGTDDVSTIQVSGQYNFLGSSYPPTTGDGWDGDVAEILIYDRNLTAEERQANFEYLRDKWLTESIEQLKVIIIPSWIFQPANALGK